MYVLSCERSIGVVEKPPMALTLIADIHYNMTPNKGKTTPKLRICVSSVERSDRHDVLFTGDAVGISTDSRGE